jgi:DNA-binding transcriptional LysR family regulator
MELKHLQTFRQVVESGSFTRAAHALGYVQSNITAHIQALESELGVPLFDRLGREVRLTSAGRQLHTYAVRLLRLADEARSAVAAGDTALTLSAPETLCTYTLPTLLRTAREQLPQLRLAFRPLHAANLRRHVRAGDIDVAFTMEPVHATPSLHAEPLRHEPILLVGPSAHPLATKERVTPAEVAREPLLLTEAGCAYRLRFEQSMAANGAVPHEVLEFSSVEAIKQCVMAGMGLAVLPTVAVVRELAAGTLASIAWSGPSLDVMTQLVWHAERWYHPSAYAFLDLARALLLPHTGEAMAGSRGEREHAAPGT